MIDVSSFVFHHKITCWEQEDEIEQVKYLAECQEALLGRSISCAPGGGGCCLSLGESCIGYRREHPGGSASGPLLWGSDLWSKQFPLKLLPGEGPRARASSGPLASDCSPCSYLLLHTELLNGDPTQLLGPEA